MGLGIVAALPHEAQCLSKCRIWPGECVSLPNHNWAQVSGIGTENARRSAESLLERGATALVSWGTAAGLDPTLATGTLVLPTTVVAHDGREYSVNLQLQSSVCSAMVNLVDVRIGKLADCSTMLSAIFQKKRLFSTSGAIAADMESASIAEVAQLAGIPFLVIRTILDTADDVVPEWVTRVVDENGRLKTSRFIARILNPVNAITLARLAFQMRACRVTLTAVATIAIPKIRVP